MRKIITSGLIILVGMLSTEVNGATITAVANGPWTTNATWSCNCQPTSADNVVIPSGKTVTITAGPVNLLLGPVITVTISGTLSLISGGTLLVDANDIVRVNSGGKITGTGILDAVWSGGTPIFVPNGTSINGPSTITSGSLPITLLFFKGEVNGDAVHLTWASASEKNFDYYAIERSRDGEVFETVAQVKGAGTSTQRIDYSFDDGSPLSGVSYYRLKSVDLDGSVETFEIIRIEFQHVNRSVDIFPNPISGNQISAKLNFDPGTGGEIAVYDIHGGLVLQQKLDSSVHEYVLDLPASIGKGIYFVSVKTGIGNSRSVLAVQ